MQTRLAAVSAVLVVGLLVVGATAWSASGAVAEGVAPVAAPPAVPAAGVGDQIVTVSAGAAAHPAAQLVLEQLELYFDAVNGRDHATWSKVVAGRPEQAQSREEWLAGIGSTVDGTIRIDRIDSEPGGVLALVRFVSSQNPQDGPPGLQVGRICWQASYRMAGAPPQIVAGEPGSLLGAPC